MKEPEKKGLPTCGTSESIVNHDEKVGGETQEESVDSGGQVQMGGSFSEELVGEDGACNGKDVMVEVLGSDVYIDGVCTRGTGAEQNDEVGCGGSVEGGGDLGKDVKSMGLSSGAEALFVCSQAVGSDEAGSESGASELDGALLEREERDQVIERINPLDAGIPGQKVANIRCDNANALGCSLTVSSIGGQNVQSVCAEKDEQKERNLTDHGATDDGNDVTLKTWDEQNNIAEQNNVVGKLNSVRGQSVGINKVHDNSSTVTLPQEVVGGAEVAADKTLLNSEEKQCFRLDKCTEKEHMADNSQFSSDTGQGMEVDKVVDGDFALDDSCPTIEVELNENVFDSEQCSLYKGMEMEVEDRPETERVKIMDNTIEIKGTSIDATAISIIVEEDTHVADQGHYAPLSAREEKFHDESNIRQNVEVEASISEQVGSNGDQEIEDFDEAEQRKTTDGKVIKCASTKLGNLEIVHQARYLLPKEKEGEFSVSDMVWGKVRSHPWWPGQIFDPSDSSEKAMKHYKKDCYLVAYFGDRTFAWNEASQLKPFRTNFFSIEKQSNSESFQNAVDCALDEITRRVEFGLACFCIPKDTYDTIKCQTVENTGIGQELNFRHGVDESLNASTFLPDKLIEYLKTLSVLPTGGFDHLELVIAKAQLLAFYRFKGYCCLPELQYCGGLDDMDTLIHGCEKNLNEVEHATLVSKNEGQAVPTNLKRQSTSRHKRKHNLKDSLHPTKKERSLSELMSGTLDSPDGDYWSEEKATDNVVLPSHSKKRRIMDHYADDTGMQDGRKTISLAKVSNTTKQSFKIGECIRRVASQLTGSPSVLKCSGERSQKTDGSTDVFSGNGSDVSLQNFEENQRSSMVVPTEYSSLDDLLSSLKWVAQEPLGDYSFVNAIVSFFSDFRNSIVVADDSGKEIIHADKVGTKRKKPSIAGSPETFEFEDMSDTYWTDRVIDNVPEEQPSRRNRNRDYQLVPAERGNPAQVSRRSNSRKRYSDGNHAEAPEKPPGYIDENAPAELVMNFAELDSVPTETNLNKMFRHFGPLKESETEVDRVSSRARVVFKKCADAEVACSSAKKFNIFGPIPVNYELNYTPSALFKASSVATTHDHEMHLDLSNFDVNMV